MNAGESKAIENEMIRGINDYNKINRSWTGIELKDCERELYKEYLSSLQDEYNSVRRKNNEKIVIEYRNYDNDSYAVLWKGKGYDRNKNK